MTTKGAANTSHASAQLSSQRSCANRVSMEERSGGMAGGKKLIAAIWIDQASPKETRPLPNQRGCLPCGVSAAPPSAVDNTPCFPRLPPYPLCADKRTQRELFKTPTGPYRRPRTIRGRDHQEPPMSWEEKTITVSRQMEGLS